MTLCDAIVKGEPCRAMGDWQITIANKDGWYPVCDEHIALCDEMKFTYIKREFVLANV